MKSILTLFRLLWQQDRPACLCYIVDMLLRGLDTTASVLVIGALVNALSDSSLALAVGLVTGLCALLAAIHISRTLVNTRIQTGLARFRAALHTMLASAALHKDYEQFETGECRERYRFAQKCVERDNIEAVMDGIVTAVSSVIAFAALSSVMSVVIWWLWLVMGLSLAVNILCEMYRLKKNFAEDQAQEATEYKMMYARDRMTWRPFAKEVRLFQMSGYISRQAEKYIEALSIMQNDRARRVFRGLLWSYLFNGVQLFVVYTYIAYQCFNGALDLAQFSVLTLSVLSVSAQATGFAGAFLSMQEAKLYAGAFVSFLKADPETEQAAAPQQVHTLSFDHVTFRYNGREENALEDISLTLEAGKKYGIVGANGAGKTTFVNLLMGFYAPTEGTVSVNGIDLSSLSQSRRSKLFSSIFQNYDIYAYPLAENVSMSDTPDLPKVRRLLELLSFPLDSDADLTTCVTQNYSDGGREYSGGEEQKIAIARALYRGAPILVLDEPSASLSPRSEAELYRLIASGTISDTVFFISHRLASCTLCDEILVFDHGKLAERGSHPALLAQDGLYAKMFTTQKRLYDLDLADEEAEAE